MNEKEQNFYRKNKEIVDKIAYEKMRRALLYGESWASYEMVDGDCKVH